ncbi:DUF1660 family phage protein [Rubripirellula amarantea]|uniref:DUF1660 family phage protein n=1 Tax=Rubripirellula amarantea TaxID=2527999 RepID=UPI0036F3E368
MAEILCWLFGHKWGVLHVTDRARGVGSCQRCRIVAANEDDVCNCPDCGHAIIRDDDDAMVCSHCGGMNRRAIVQA